MIRLLIFYTLVFFRKKVLKEIYYILDLMKLDSLKYDNIKK